MLHLLSGIPVQLQLIPASPRFPHSHGLSDSDMEGAAILKVGQSAHLTSFSNIVLCFFKKSLLKSGLLVSGKGQREQGRSEQPQHSLQKDLFGAQLLTVVCHNDFQLTKGLTTNIACIFTWSRCCVVRT